MKHPGSQEYPIDIVTDIVRFYKQGVTISELAAKYQRAEAQVKIEIEQFTRLHGRDSISKNMQTIQMAESRLIQMAAEMKNGSTTGAQIQRYRGLLFWYSKADLNEGIVFIPENLLV